MHISKRRRSLDTLAFRNEKRIELFVLLCLAAAIVGGGCKKTSGDVPVHGKITYHDQPLNASSVTFYPTTGRPVTAGAPKGEYATELAPGTYTVSVAVGIEYPPGYKEGDPAPAPKVVLPPEYATRAQSKLTATVNAGQTEPINFNLK
jgi:hypothetical protein